MRSVLDLSCAQFLVWVFIINYVVAHIEVCFSAGFSCLSRKSELFLPEKRLTWGRLFYVVIVEDGGQWSRRRSQ